MYRVHTNSSPHYVSSLVTPGSSPNPDELYDLHPKLLLFIHSFIHTEHLYSASSRELLRGAPNSSTAKKSYDHLEDLETMHLH